MELKTILKWRSVWMGVAMLWMVVYHSSLVFPFKVLSYIQQFGYGGVDIFLFASGLGCYYSLSKDDNSADFIKRRVARILPTYWLFLVFWSIYKIQTIQLPFTAVLGNFLCVQTFTGLGNDFNWYISTMWMLYFLAPYFYSKLKHYDTVKQYIGMLILLLLFTIPFWNSMIYIIGVTRVPIFFMGMCVGKFAKEQNPYINTKWICLLLALMLLGAIGLVYCYNYQSAYLWGYGLYWYPFILIVPGLCLLVSLVMEAITKNVIGKWLEKGVSIVGKYSFEVYLVHACFYDVYRYYVIPVDPKYNGNRYWLLVILLVIPLSMLFAGMDKMMRALGRKWFRWTI